MLKLILITLDVDVDEEDNRSVRTEAECWTLFREMLKDVCLGESVLQLQGIRPLSATVEELESAEVPIG